MLINIIISILQLQLINNIILILPYKGIKQNQIAKLQFFNILSQGTDENSKYTKMIIKRKLYYRMHQLSLND